MTALIAIRAHACHRQRLEVADFSRRIVEEAAIRADAEIVMQCAYHSEAAIERGSGDTGRQCLGPGMQMNDGIRRVESIEYCAQFLRGSAVPNSASGRS